MNPPDDALIEACAQALWTAERTATPMACLTDTHPALDEATAYAIQARKLALRGSRPVGFKLGYTSTAMRQQMNIDHPNFGVLTEDHRVDEAEGHVAAAPLIHPRVEPEIALLTGRDISGTGHNRHSIFRAVDAVLPALEIVDTRYHDYQFKLTDNISDNSSSARFVTGSPVALSTVPDLRLLGVLLWSQGRTLDHGIGANALGDPLLALAWLAGFLAERGEIIPAGSLILTGGLTRAHPATAGQTLIAEFASLGMVRVHFG
jgi:2-keto-4-pentenoate hydratase